MNTEEQEELYELRLKNAMFDEYKERAQKTLGDYTEQILNLTFENRKLEYKNYNLEKQLKKLNTTENCFSVPQGD